MPNIASVLKSEIARLARKEVRAHTDSLKKQATSHRAEIAALKRRALQLEQLIRSLAKTTSKLSAKPETEQVERPIRYSAKSLASQRRRLGLSAEDCGLLVGASGQSIHNWEAGEIRPRAKHLPAIAALRHMGKREAAERLAALRAAE